MRFISILSICGVLLVGCRHSPAGAPIASMSPRPSMKPVNRVEGRVVSVNTTLKYVVVDFPTGKPPASNQRLNVYRSGQKVAEVIVSPQSRDTKFAADIVAGDIQSGDEVRDD